VNLVRDTLQAINNLDSFSLNINNTYSLWGEVSTKLFMSNTLTDRKFVSGLWRIGNEVKRILRLNNE
jgi:hypothetical protein